MNSIMDDKSLYFDHYLRSCCQLDDESNAYVCAKCLKLQIDLNLFQLLCDCVICNSCLSVNTSNFIDDEIIDCPFCGQKDVKPVKMKIPEPIPKIECVKTKQMIEYSKLSDHFCMNIWEMYHKCHYKEFGCYFLCEKEKEMNEHYKNDESCHQRMLEDFCSDNMSSFDICSSKGQQKLINTLKERLIILDDLRKETNLQQRVFLDRMNSIGDIPDELLSRYTTEATIVMDGFDKTANHLHEHNDSEEFYMMNGIWGVNGRQGYKFKLRVYLQGDENSDDYTSFYFILLPGIYDDFNRWPLQTKITLAIYNPDSTRLTSPSDTYFQLKPNDSQDTSSFIQSFTHSRDLKRPRHDYKAYGNNKFKPSQIIKPCIMEDKLYLKMFIEKDNASSF